MKLAAMVFALLALAASSAAHAEGAMTVTLDKARLIHLRAPAVHVVVGNPAIADVTMESPTTLFLFGKEPGETNVMVLDDQGQTLLSTSVVVVMGNARVVSVYRPSKDGPTQTRYSCVGVHCLRLSSQGGAAASQTEATPATPQTGVAASGKP